MIKSMNHNDKLVVYSLLIKVMDADNIEDPKEREI